MHERCCVGTWTLSRCFCAAASPRPWLFVGLGNGGDKYQATRHNAGFDVIDAFAQSQGISMDTVHCKAFFGQVSLYLSQAGPLAAYYKLPLNHLVVINTALQGGVDAFELLCPHNQMLDGECQMLQHRAEVQACPTLRKGQYSVRIEDVL